jgi:hypothetical protein
MSRGGEIAPASLRTLASIDGEHYSAAMIIIRFPDMETKRRALGFLPGRFSFKSWATGEMMIPKNALGCLALEGFRFTVEGRATPERLVDLQNANPPR